MATQVADSKATVEYKVSATQGLGWKFNDSTVLEASKFKVLMEASKFKVLIKVATTV